MNVLPNRLNEVLENERYSREDPTLVGKGWEWIRQIHSRHSINTTKALFGRNMCPLSYWIW